MKIKRAPKRARRESKGKVEQALDKARREIVAEDKEFFNAAMAARKVFNGEQLRKASETISAELILWLLSDKALDRGERRALAQLLAGELHTRGARVKKGDDKRAYWELMAEIKAAHSEGHRTKTKRQLIELALSDPRAKGKGRATLLRDWDLKNPYNKDSGLS